MTSINKVILLGRAGGHPDIRYMKGARKEARFTLATGRQPRKQWHRVVLFDRLAQVAEDHVSNGVGVLVEGYIHYDSYESDDVTVPTMEIIAREVTILKNDMPAPPLCDCGRS